MRYWIKLYYPRKYTIFYKDMKLPHTLHKSTLMLNEKETKEVVAVTFVEVLWVEDERQKEYSTLNY